MTRTTPVQYLPRDGAFVVVAADAGAARPPAWYLNLCAVPYARVRVGARDVDVRLAKSETRSATPCGGSSRQPTR